MKSMSVLIFEESRRLYFAFNFTYLGSTYVRFALHRIDCANGEGVDFDYRIFD